MISIEDEITTAIRSFLISVNSDVVGFDAVWGQQNRESMPIGNFAVITPLFIKRLSTSGQFYDNSSSSISVYDVQSADVQLDFYGDLSASTAARAETLFRSGAGYDLISENSNYVRVLYCDQARQSSIENGQDQWESRWIITVTVQLINPQTLNQQFFDVVESTTEAIT